MWSRLIRKRMARKIQKNMDLGPEGVSEAWFPVEYANVEQSDSKVGEEMVVITFTSQDGDDNPITLQKFFTPFHTEHPFPRHIWNTFARGMGSVGHAPRGETRDALLADSDNWLMPDRIGCRQEEDNHGEVKWVPVNWDWGEPVGDAQLYEPPDPARYAAPPEEAEEEVPPAQHGDDGSPIAAAAADDLPF